MARSIQIAILSDVHYACEAERARGSDYEFRDLPNPVIRKLVDWYRHYIWLRDPVGHNDRLDVFLARVGSPDWVIANGDYNCDTAFVGVSNEASRQSARECLDRLREKFAPNLRAVAGDHELGKLSLFGGRGGLRLESLRRSREDLGLPSFWRVDLGNYVLAGVTSSLIALPLLVPDILPEEKAEWERQRAEHLAAIRALFAGLNPCQRVILFCHDPSALPFLWRDETVRGKIAQIELTIIGHLHSNLVFRTSRILSGMPPIRFLGHTALRLSTALAEARCWRPFNVRLCPSLAGIELLKDGGFCTLDLDEDAQRRARFEFHHMKR